jgi:4-hydroxy-tetrahydrodipicolinate reductase
LKQARAGHAGLKESLALIAHSLRWDLKHIRETGGAIVAKRNVRTRYLHVRKGETCGLHQRIEAIGAAQSQLTLDLKMYLEARDPHDTISIDGDPPVKITIAGGIAGDQATVAALVNTAPRLLGAAPGLRLLTELPITSRDVSAWEPSRHSSAARS